jgi:hypothetical protein
MLVANHMSGVEMEKVMHTFPHDMQWLFPAFASAA